MSYILCLSSSRWLKQPTRTQWLLTQLNHRHQILYFQPAPAKFTRDPRRNDYKKKGWHPQPNITVYTLPPIYHLVDYDHPRLLRSNVKRLSKYISEKTAEAHVQNPLLWVCSPLYATLLDELDCRGIVYDCYQDWPQFDIRWESILANRADVLFAASPGLVEHLAPCNSNIALLPNGCDVKLFSRADDLTLRAPSLLLKIRGPIFGFLGDVSGRLDLRPAYRAARQHAAWSFVFAGRCSRVNPLYERMSALPNVHFLGKIDPEELPAYGAQCDVLIDLLETDDPDEDVVPSRIYEYLVIGKPIAAMYPLRFIPVFSDVIYSGRDSKEFVDACYQALMENSAWAPATRKRYGQQADWSARSGEAERILESNSLL